MSYEFRVMCLKRVYRFMTLRGLKKIFFYRLPSTVYPLTSTLYRLTSNVYRQPTFTLNPRTLSNRNLKQQKPETTKT